MRRQALTSVRRPLPGSALAVPVITALLGGCQQGASVTETLTTGFETVTNKAGKAFTAVVDTVSPTVELPKEGTLLASLEPTDFDYSALEANRPRDLAQERSTGRGLIDAPPLTDYLNKVLGRVAEQAPAQNVPARIYVKDSLEINASALPSGAIVVPMGLLRVIATEDELAFLLGHEFSHVMKRHHDSDWYLKAQKYSLAGMELGFDVAKSFRHRFAGKAENRLDDLMLANEASLLLSETLLSPAWTRSQEDEADVLGLDLMYTAGYDYRAAFTLVDKLGEAEKQLVAEQKQPGERVLDYLESRVDETSPSRHIDPTKWQSLVEGVAKQTWTWVNRQFTRNHRTHEERRTFLNEYADAEGRYVTAIKPRQPVPWSTQGRKAPPRAVTSADAAAIRAAFDNYEIARRAEEALEKRDAKGALALATKASRAPIEHATYPRIIVYDAQLALGKREAGAQALRPALASSEPALIVYMRMLDTPIAKRDWSEAQRLVDQARETIGDPPQLLPLRVYLLVKQDNKVEALALSSECRLQNPEGIGALCAQALEGRDWQPRERIATRS